jgi:hypothetical protein
METFTKATIALQQRVGSSTQLLEEIKAHACALLEFLLQPQYVRYSFHNIREQYPKSSEASKPLQEA